MEIEAKRWGNSNSPEKTQGYRRKRIKWWIPSPKRKVLYIRFCLKLLLKQEKEYKRIYSLIDIAIVILIIIESYTPRDRMLQAPPHASQLNFFLSRLLFQESYVHFLTSTTPLKISLTLQIGSLWFFRIQPKVSWSSFHWLPLFYQKLSKLLKKYIFLQIDPILFIDFCLLLIFYFRLEYFSFFFSIVKFHMFFCLGKFFLWKVQIIYDLR